MKHLNRNNLQRNVEGFLFAGTEKLTKTQVDIIDAYINESFRVLVGHNIIMDTGSGYDAMIEMTARLKEVTPKHCEKIQNYSLNDWAKTKESRSRYYKRK